MGRWRYRWHVQYYGSGRFIRDFYTDAKDRAEALKNLHDTGATVIEILSCERTDRW